MTSSTSSSEPTKANEFWGPSLILALVLTAVYALLSMSPKFPTGKGISQYQANWVALEKCVRDHHGKQVIMCGSSMSKDIHIEVLDPRAMNLGLLDSSSYTGLEAVRMSKSQPRVVLVEMSFPVAQPLNTESLDKLKDPYLSFVAENLKFLRQDHQPTDILLSKFRKNPAKVLTVPPAPQEVCDQFLRKMGTHFVPGQEQRLRDNLTAMKEQIKDLEAKGVRVFLYELLYDTRVNQAPQFLQASKMIHEMFPESEYNWLKVQEADKVETTDAVHMIPKQANAIAHFFVGKFDGWLSGG